MRQIKFKTVLCLLTATALSGTAFAQSADEAAIPVRKNSNDSASASSVKPSVISRLQSASRGEKPPAAASNAKSAPSSSDSPAERSASRPVVKVSVPTGKPTTSVSSQYNLESSPEKKSDSSSSTDKSEKKESASSEKSSGSKSTSAKNSSTGSSTKKETAKSSTASKADLALVKDLQSSARSSASSSASKKSSDSASDKKATGKSKDAGSSKTSKDSEKESGESKEVARDSSKQSSRESYVDPDKNPFRDSKREDRDTGERSPSGTVAAPDSHHDDHDHGEEGNLASEIATVPGPAPVTAPSLYLPQPPEKASLFSKLFGRRHTPAPRGQSTPFSSDYATRGDAILPTVIQGNGFNGRDLPIGQEDPYRLAGLTNEFRPTDLVQVPVSLCHYGNQLYLRREAATSLCNMLSDATRQGYCIRVVSAYRDYGHQLRLYNQAVSRGGPNQKSVARPGKSEHHLGTTVDLTNNETHALKRSFGNTPEGKWLAANAHRYGWKLTVMSENARRSHNEEPWHLRYLGSHVNSHGGISDVANANPRPQRRSVLGSVSRMLHIGRN